MMDGIIAGQSFMVALVVGNHKDNPYYI